MNLEQLSEKLLKEKNDIETLSKFSCIQTPDIKKKTSRRVPILKRCLNFLLSAAKNQNYNYIPPILKFVRTATSLDYWLVSSSSIILPHLSDLYCMILAEADPCSHRSPRMWNVQISSRVKRDKDAMRALCSVFQVCVGFCDLVDEDNQRQLGKFLTCSAAVLFGSDFQKERGTLNETDYAMDELARYSSYALSNIMLTYPAVIPIAENILGKRLRDLFKFLHSSPELSINRSLILILRSLYQRYESDQGDSHKYRRFIDNVFSSSQFGSQSVLSLFQKINLFSEDAATQAEKISLMMYSVDCDDPCFKTMNCSIQVKEKPCCSRRRVPFRSASVDWNRNSFMIQRLGQRPEYWPLFSVLDLDWKKGRRELHLQLDGRPKKQAYGIVIRFQSDSVSASKKVIIEDRLRQTMERIKLQVEEKAYDHNATARKISYVIQGVDRFNEPGLNGDHLKWNENTREGTQFSARVKQKHIFSETRPHEVYAYSSHSEEDSLTSSQNSYVDSVNKNEQESKAEAVKAECNHNDVNHSSSLSGTRARVQLRDAMDNKGSQKCLSGDHSVPNYPSSEVLDKTRPSENVNRVSTAQEDGSHNNNEEDSQEQLVDVSPFAAPSLNEDVCRKASHSICEQRNSRRRVVLEKEADKIISEELTPDIGMKDSEVELKNEKGLKELLTVEDEHLRQKLQLVVKNMLQRKQGQIFQLLRDTKVSIKNMREKRIREDEELVTKFANGVRKNSSLHTRKLTDRVREAKGILQKTRRRVISLQQKLTGAQQSLKVMKTESSTDISHARDLMRKEREELTTNLNQCVANTQRQSECRAKKNSMLQSLARLLQEG